MSEQSNRAVITPADLIALEKDVKHLRANDSRWVTEQAKQARAGSRSRQPSRADIALDIAQSTRILQVDQGLATKVLDESDDSPTGPTDDEWDWQDGYEWQYDYGCEWQYDN